MRKFARVLMGSAVAASAVVMPFAFTGPAHAGQDAEACTEAADLYIGCGGFMKFEAHGEHFTLTDGSRDGAGVYLEVVAGNEVRPIMWNSQGTGTSKHYNESYPEGAIVTYRLCLRNNGTIINATCTSGQAVA